MEQNVLKTARKRYVRKVSRVNYLYLFVLLILLANDRGRLPGEGDHFSRNNLCDG